MAYLLLGRVGGMSDTALMLAWQGGEREDVIGQRP